jgi:hypothetical protein
VLLVQVCGMLVEQATHKEVVSIIKDRTNLNLKVRSGGLLPVKENRSNPIHWQIIKVRVSYIHWQIIKVRDSYLHWQIIKVRDSYIH